MKILIAEDDEIKRSQLEACVYELASDTKIVTARSYQSAVRKLINEPVDLVILDMTMPTYDIGKTEDGGRSQHFAGREILRQMDRREIKTGVIVVTGYSSFGEGSDVLSRQELDRQLKQDHSQYLGMIYYKVADDEWKSLLVQKIMDAGRKPNS